MSFLRVEVLRSAVPASGGNPAVPAEHHFMVEQDVRAVAANLDNPAFTYYQVVANPAGRPVLHEVREKAGSRLRVAIVETFELEADGEVVGSGREEI